jgi:hypothetical protein
VKSLFSLGFVNARRYADLTGLGQSFEPCRDVHSVAEYVLAVGDHIPKVDTDAELDLLLRRGPRIPLGHTLLHLNGTAHSLHDAREFRQKAVTGVLYDPAAVLGDLWIDESPRWAFSSSCVPSSSAILIKMFFCLEMDRELRHVPTYPFTSPVETPKPVDAASLVAPAHSFGRGFDGAFCGCPSPAGRCSFGVSR